MEVNYTAMFIGLGFGLFCCAVSLVLVFSNMRPRPNYYAYYIGTYIKDTPLEVECDAREYKVRIKDALIKYKDGNICETWGTGKTFNRACKAYAQVLDECVCVIIEEADDVHKTR